MAVQGDHRTVSIPELFDFIAHQKLDGVLVVASQSQERSFGFRRGELEYALLNDPGQLLGEVLARELQIECDPFDRIIASLGPNEFLGEALIREGLATEREVRGVVGRQIRRALREVLRWKSWAFHFADRIRQDAPTVRLTTSTQSLVLDLTRELDEWNRVDEVFFDLDCVPRRLTESVQSRKPDEWPSGLPAPGKVLLEVDGHRSVRTLLEESPYPVHPLAVGLAQLIEGGLVELLPRIADESEEARSHFSLPVVPDRSGDLLRLLSKEKIDSDEVHDLIVGDPVLAARALRLVASRGEPTNDLRAAIGRTGHLALHTLLLAESARRFAASKPSFWPQLWRASMRTAEAAALLAREVTGVAPGDARLAGLLHNVGALALAADDPDGYRTVEQQSIGVSSERLIQNQRAVLGTDECRVGAALADHWGFPAHLKSILREHHSPLEHPKNRLLSVVRLAIAIADPASDGLRLDRLQRKLAKRLGVSNSNCQRIREQITGARVESPDASVLA
ncbi:MAG: HDOD domain-containing protein [Planctomycetota bacterium]